MKNILTYEKYRNLVRLSESLNYEEDENLNEGVIAKIKEKISTSHVDRVLKEEIELGKMVEERIKETMSELDRVCQSLNVKTSTGSKFKKSLNKIIDDINKTSFDTLSLLGDANVDFSGFKRSATMANVVNLSVLLSPIKNTLMLRRAYKYFIGLIKQSLRRDLVMLLVNFDQFQNMILQKSMESEESAKVSREVNQAYGKIEGMYQQALAEAVGRKSSKFMDKIKKAMEIKKQEVEIMDKHNPMAEFFMNSYDNTYKQTADTLKTIMGEDNQKLLDAHKASISKLGHGDDHLTVYGELLISAAEEKALKTTIAIHTNFLKISEVFKLSNQKKLVEMMQKSEEEYQNEIAQKEKERKEKEEKDFDEETIKYINTEGKKIFDSIKSFDDYDKLHGDAEGQPKGLSLAKKEVLVRYLMANESEIAHKPYLYVAVPLDKYDSHYNECYLSYLDILVNKVLKSFDDKNHKISTSELNDKEGAKEIRKKLIDGKALSKAKVALKIISDEVVEFDYNLLLTKIDKGIGTGSKEAEISPKAFKDFTDALNYMKKYKDNDYTAPSAEKKSED